MLCIKKDQEIRLFVDRRAGIVWPTSQNPGYFCLFGMEDIPKWQGVKPLVLLSEGESTDKNKLIEGFWGSALKYHCHLALAELSGEAEQIKWWLYQFIAARNLRGIEIYDATPFTGFEQARPHMTKQSPVIPKSAILRKQLSGMTKEDFMVQDRVQPAQRFHAAYAMCHVITSYVMYPWQKPQKEYVNTGSGEGYR